MLARSNHRHLNIGWEPFATSTPLKIVPNNVNLNKEVKKQFQLRTHSLDINQELQKRHVSGNVSVEKPSSIKRSINGRQRRSKSFSNLDISSSDEDNAKEKRRPVIKLGTKKETNSLLMNNKSNESANVVKNVTNHDNCSASSSETNKFDQSLKHYYNHILNCKKKNQKDNEKLATAISLNSDEEIQIFEKRKDLKKNPKLNLKNKEKDHDKSDNEIKNKLKTHSNVERDSPIPKSVKKTKLENKVIKKKCKNIKNANNSVKITKINKAKSKLLASSVTEFRKSAATPLHLIDIKRNTSHQLFSDSKGQELLNSLDLTSEEKSETKEGKSKLLWSKEIKLSFASSLPNHSNHKNFFEMPNKDKPKSQDNPVDVELTEDQCNDQLPAADAKEQLGLEQDLKEVKKNNELMQDFQVLVNTEGNDGCQEECTTKRSLRLKKTEGKVKKKVTRKPVRKKETLVTNNAANNTGNTNCNGVEKGLEPVENNLKVNKLAQIVEEEKIATAEKPVFKLINELSFKEDEMGCSATECWDVNTFKCGIFKLKIKSQMTCKTLHRNSHLGGVLIKGNIRMKIGNKELELNQGDMAFVPPLTVWQAKNIGKCESVFYYWCGRFNV